MTADRMTHLHDVGRLLWPEPLALEVGRGRRAGAVEHREFLLLPSGRRPRLLVPNTRRAAVAALRGYGVGRGRSARLLAAGLAAALASGVAPLVLRDRVRILDRSGGGGDVPSIESHLSAVLGTEVVVSMYLGAPRANRKPVLQVLTPQGRTIAYAKVGVDPLTCRLVRDEAAALQALGRAGLGAVHRARACCTAASGTAWSCWCSRRCRCGETRSRPTVEQVVAAQREVADVGRRRRRAAGRVAVVDRPERPDRRASRLRRRPRPGRPGRARREGPRARSRCVSAPGTATGTPWNTRPGRRTGCWSGTGSGSRPTCRSGYDALHWALQTGSVTHLADPGEAARRSLVTAGPVLEPFGLSTEQVRATAVAYLMELAARYLADRQAEAGARLGDVDSWLLPAVRGAPRTDATGRPTDRRHDRTEDEARDDTHRETAPVPGGQAGGAGGHRERRAADRARRG